MASLRVGSEVPMERTSSGGYELTGPAASFGWAAMCCFGLLLLDAGLGLAGALLGAPRIRRVSVLLMAALGAGALLGALVAAVLDLTAAL